MSAQTPEDVDPVVGRCPRCRTSSPQVGYCVGGVSNIEHPEWVTDWDMYALCHRCRVRWQVGHLCDPPSEGAFLFDDRQDPYRTYELVAPLDVADESAAAYFARMR